MRPRSLSESRSTTTGWASPERNGRSSCGRSALPLDDDNLVGVGSDARWATPGASCTLEILDHNAIIVTSYHSGQPRLDPRRPQCRDGAREVTKDFYHAIQPR